MTTQAQASMTKSERAGVYMEPELFAIASVAAEKEGETLSNWIRTLIMLRLKDTGHLTDEMIFKMASKR